MIYIEFEPFAVCCLCFHGKFVHGLANGQAKPLKLVCHMKPKTMENLKFSSDITCKESMSWLIITCLPIVDYISSTILPT